MVNFLPVLPSHRLSLTSSLYPPPCPKMRHLPGHPYHSALELQQQHANGAQEREVPSLKLPSVYLLSSSLPQITIGSLGHEQLGQTTKLYMSQTIFDCVFLQGYVGLRFTKSKDMKIYGHIFLQVRLFAICSCVLNFLLIFVCEETRVKMKNSMANYRASKSLTSRIK